MTRKHFNALAAQIRYMPIDHATKRLVADSIADTCSQFNSNFDRGRFIEACHG